MPNLLKQFPNLGKLPDTQKQKFRNGVGGNFDTVSFMKKIAHQYKSDPEIRRLAETILNDKGIVSHNHLDEAMAIGEFVQKNCAYMKDPKGVEQLQEPTLMLKRMKEGKCRGDCDDMALLICTLLLSAGIQPYLAIVKYSKDAAGFQHIYVVVYEKNHKDQRQRIPLDAIIKDKLIGYEVSSAERKEIKV